MASVNLYVGVYYLFFYLKRPKIHEHLPFALLCLSVAIYDVCSIGLYNSISIRDGIFWQRLQLDTAVAISIFLIWFTGVFTEQKENRVLKYSIVWFIIILIASLFASPELTLSASNPAIKNVSFFNLQNITYYEGAVGVIYQVELVSVICTFVYLCYLFIRYYQKTHYKTLFLILSALIIYFIGTVNDSLVAFQAYSFIYINEYSFFFLILAMAYTLLDKFVNLHISFENLNVNLEREVLERTSKIRKLNEDLKYLADRDGLTGVYNRRFFNEYIEIETKRAKNYLDFKTKIEPYQEKGMNFGLAIIDIDHFKQINDKYGHQVGDTVLIETAKIVERNMFTRDILCRYGGDEFVLLLTKTSTDGILKAIEKIRNEIDKEVFKVDGNGVNLHITISAGLANFDEIHDLGSEEILKLADDRLLRAKNLGRNRIVYSDDV